MKSQVVRVVKMVVSLVDSSDGAPNDQRARMTEIVIVLLIKSEKG